MKSPSDGKHRESYGTMRQDMFQKAISKYQITAQSTKFRDAENEKKEYKQFESRQDGYKYENGSNCDAAYWSSQFVSDNWEFRANQKKNIQEIKGKMKGQHESESKINEFYALSHRHPSNRESESDNLSLQQAITAVKTVAAAVSAASLSQDHDENSNISSKQKAKDQFHDDFHTWSFSILPFSRF